MQVRRLHHAHLRQNHSNKRDLYMPCFPIRLCLSILALTTAVSVAVAEEGHFHGSISRTPAKRWEDGFVTGNGRMGALFFGEPGNETLVANHCRLFLPLGNREIVPDLAQYVPELRRIIREKGYGPAMKFFSGKAKEQGYPGLIPTDPFHPGLFVNIRQKAAGPVTDYERTEDFQTGEVTCPLATTSGASSSAGSSSPAPITSSPFWS